MWNEQIPRNTNPTKTKTWIENLNRRKEIKSVMKYLSTKKIPGPEGFIGEIYQIFHCSIIYNSEKVETT